MELATGGAAPGAARYVGGGGGGPPRTTGAGATVAAVGVTPGAAEVYSCGAATVAVACCS